MHKVIFFVLSVCFAWGCGCASRPDLQRFEFSKPQMGVPFRLVLYAPSEAVASNAAHHAFARVERLNSILSDYDYDSEVSKLSRTSGSNIWIKVSEDLWNVISHSKKFAEESNGAFDPTIGPVVNLWRHARRLRELPDPQRLSRAMEAVGYRNIELNSRSKSVRLRVPNMRLDFGGIAKGYAVEEALKVVKVHGIRSALVGAAGDIAVSSAPPGRKHWRLEAAGIEEGQQDFMGLKNSSITTSGDLFQFLEINNVRYSHILDPRTGVGLTNHVLVTTIGPNCTEADAAATALSVLPQNEWATFLQKHPRIEARILYNSRFAGKGHFETPGFREYRDQ